MIGLGCVISISKETRRVKTLLLNQSVPVTSATSVHSMVLKSKPTFAAQYLWRASESRRQD